MLTDLHTETSWPHVANSHGAVTTHISSGVFRVSAWSHIIMRKLSKTILEFLVKEKSLKTQSIVSQKQRRLHFKVFLYLNSLIVKEILWPLVLCNTCISHHWGLLLSVAQNSRRASFKLLYASVDLTRQKRQIISWISFLFLNSLLFYFKMEKHGLT